MSFSFVGCFWILDSQNTCSEVQNTLIFVRGKSNNVPTSLHTTVQGRLTRQKIYVCRHLSVGADSYCRKRLTWTRPSGRAYNKSLWSIAYSHLAGIGATPPICLAFLSCETNCPTILRLFTAHSIYMICCLNTCFTIEASKNIIYLIS